MSLIWRFKVNKEANAKVIIISCYFTRSVTIDDSDFIVDPTKVAIDIVSGIIFKTDCNDSQLAVVIN